MSSGNRSVGSMGWLTESSVQPRQARPIPVDQASVVNLKATLYATEQEMKSGTNELRKKTPGLTISAKTAARDQQAAKQEALEAEERINRMNVKVALYQKLVNLGGADSNSLIDFEKKGWESEAGFVPAGADDGDGVTAPPLSAPADQAEVLDRFRKTLTHVEKQMVKEVEAETELARQRFTDMQKKRQHEIEKRKEMLKKRKLGQVSNAPST